MRNIRLGIFRCPTCGTYYNPTYGSCPTCHPSHRPYLSFWVLIPLLLTLICVATPVAAQIRPMPVQALSGTTYIDLNANGARDYGEPARSGIIIEVRHINSEITNVWRSTSDNIGSYRLLLWDPGQYDLTAHCTDSGSQASSIYICWRSTAPLVIDGAGHTIDIPIPARRLYLPIVRK